jgi:ArsR family transcriptional regulator, arsenate/arsenite/antimonite-responsive transcriptional repressor / arsenate reductase (thioredoxin)
VEFATDLARRAAVHAALGEPARLAIVDDLARSDRSPKELGERFAIPTNLLAHHLDVLERVGLIERFVSAGDRRRRYVRLIPSAVDAPAAPRGVATGRALFVCTHNSARSQLAAALWRAHTGAGAASAGTHPAGRVHPGAVAAARRAGLDLANAVPRHLDDLDEDDDSGHDFVVTVCDRAHEELDVGDDWWHWSVPDPVDAGTAAAFDAALTDIDARIRSLTRDDEGAQP